MTYELIYTRRAKRDVDALDRVAKHRLAKKLELFQLSPLRFAEKLVSSQFGQYRFRVGDYRIIFDIHGSHLVILRVGHRREIYR